MKFVRHGFVACIVLTLNACIVVPMPLKGRIADSDLKRIQPGISTLDDVISRAGEPTFIWENKKVAVFNDGATMEWGVLTINGGGSAGVSDYEAFLVLFDDAGIVRKIEKKDWPKRQVGWAAFLADWAVAPAKGESE